MSTRPLGLHIRITESLFDVVEKAMRLQLPTFQCFLTAPTTGHVLNLSATDIERFNSMCTSFKRKYVHVSYHANVADPQSVDRFKREVMLARKLGFTHAVVHPGSAKWCGNKEQGIAALAESINNVCEEVPDIAIVLENAAHGNLTIGGDIEDLGIILSRVRCPDRVEFCIDTAHAYVYGYNIAEQIDQDRFINLAYDILGTKITLIHLNDTVHEYGSRLDKHQIVGEGLIGDQALKRFMLHSRMRNIPVIMELPILLEDQEMRVYRRILAWDN